MDTLSALNTWHLGSNASDQTEQQVRRCAANNGSAMTSLCQAHQLVFARRVSAPRKMPGSAFAPATSAMAIDQHPRQQERMRHGSGDALAMLRSSSATSDGLAATLEGYGAMRRNEVN